MEAKLKLCKIPYQREVAVNVQFENNPLGEFFVDFIIDGKILLELKKVGYITRDHIKQVLRYLDATGIKLGIIANFKYSRLQYRRIIKS